MSKTRVPGRGLSRRAFLQGSALSTVAVASAGRLAARTTDAGLGDRAITVALVGCGGRGGGAARQALATQRSGGGPVKLVAMADAFRDRLDQCHQTLVENLGEGASGLEVPEENKYVGFDAYRKAIDSGADVVILATPPGFRPEHFEHAVRAGKHVFMEKPVAVDGPGVRRVLAAAAEAKAKSLKIGVGLQRHHDPAYLETVRRIHDGAIGDVVALRVYWNSAGVWVRPRQAAQTEMEYQMRNWYYFNWLCGDHIVEQHIHNLDVGNWVKGAHPVEAQGQGGRQVRTGKQFGEIYDHHFVEYTYADGATMISQCRHQEGCWDQVAEYAHGIRGRAAISDAEIAGTGGWDWRYDGGGGDPYQLEHDALFGAIRRGEEHDETENGACATLTAILGRMATYSGKRVTWEEALESGLDLSPARYAWDADPPVLPDAEGRYPIASPGVTVAR
ncbi:MAG TPA: Gfo/Idh/MocA family oxidoreductase [Thermoanaerobaculia bacterium]|nr:Gfo/Idh/MocA family oxidoreductase [Thermoanaerobaculia bacterium]